MKENTNVLKRLIKSKSNMSAIFAIFALIFAVVACNKNTGVSTPDNKLEISSLVRDSTLEEKSGFYFPTKEYNNEYYSFHIANYELNTAGEDSLKTDTANGDNQIKVSFLLKKKKVDKPEDLIGEYKGADPNWEITNVRVYSPKGLIYLQKPDKFKVKITSVNKDVVNGEIEMEDEASKPNKIKGKFAVKQLPAANNANGNANLNK